MLLIDVMPAFCSKVWQAKWLFLGAEDARCFPQSAKQTCKNLSLRNGSYLNVENKRSIVDIHEPPRWLIFFREFML